eukprot:6185493-Pleurochrysis_carterae.AAC.1
MQASFIVAPERQPRWRCVTASCRPRRSGRRQQRRRCARYITPSIGRPCGSTWRTSATSVTEVLAGICVRSLEGSRA